MTDQNQNTMWFTAYTPGGYKMSITLAIDPKAIPSAAEMDALLAQLGYHPQLVDLPADTNLQEVNAVVRAETSKGDTLLYCYNTALEWKVGQLYMNNKDDIAAFEAASGLKIASLPLYEGQGAPQRKDKAPTKWERPCRTFTLAKTLIGKDDQDRPKYKYALHTGKAAPAAQKPAPEPTPENWHQMSAAAALQSPEAQAELKAHLAGLDERAIRQVLKINRWSEFSGTFGELLDYLSPNVKLASADETLPF